MSFFFLMSVQIMGPSDYVQDIGPKFNSLPITANYQDKNFVGTFFVFI